MFCAQEIARLRGCLDRLLPHLDRAAVALTGGVAIEYHLAAAGRPGIRETVADLDLVTSDVNGIGRGVTWEFLVSHHHRPGPGVPKAFLQLVDPLARLRIDIFPDLDAAIADAHRAAVAPTSLLVLSARSVLEHKLRTIRKASSANPVDPKHWRDAVALADISGCALPELSLHLKPSVLGADCDAPCMRCERSSVSHFPLAPKREIFAILGYV